METVRIEVDSRRGTAELSDGRLFVGSEVLLDLVTDGSADSSSLVRIYRFDTRLLKQWALAEAAGGGTLALNSVEWREAFAGVAPERAMACEIFVYSRSAIVAQGSVTVEWSPTLTVVDGTPIDTKGEKGEKGDKGDKGDRGDPGKSAYQGAVENGYTGTESRFYRSLGGLEALAEGAAASARAAGVSAETAARETLVGARQLEQAVSARDEAVEAAESTRKLAEGFGADDFAGLLEAAEEVSGTVDAVALHGEAIFAGTDEAAGELFASRTRVEGYFGTAHLISQKVSSGQACDPAGIVLVTDVAEDFIAESGSTILAKFGQYDRGFSSVCVSPGEIGAELYVTTGGAESKRRPFASGRHVVVASYERLSDTQTRVRFWVDGSLMSDHTFTGLNGLNLLVGGTTSRYDGLSFVTDFYAGAPLSEDEASEISEAGGRAPLAYLTHETLERTRQEMQELSEAIAAKPDAGDCAPRHHGHAANEISSGELSYMRLPVATGMRKGAVYPGAGLEVNDLGCISVRSGTFAAASHTHQIAGVYGLSEALAQKAAATPSPKTSDTLCWMADCSMLSLSPPDGELPADTEGWPEGAQLFVRLTVPSSMTLPDFAVLLGYAALEAGAVYHLAAWRVGSVLYLNPIYREPS